MVGDILAAQAVYCHTKTANTKYVWRCEIWQENVKPFQLPTMVL